MADRDWADDEARVLANVAEHLNLISNAGRDELRYHLAAALRRERERGYEQGRLDALTGVLRTAGLERSP